MHKRRRGVFCGVLAAGLLLLCASPARADEGEEAARLLEAAKARLHKTAWELVLTPYSGGGGTLTDKLQFADETMSSQRLGAQEFPESRVTINVEDSGTVTWDSMQKSAKSGIAFWHGELRGAQMRGVFTFKNPKGESTNYAFVGTTAAFTAPAPPPEPPVAAEPPSADATTTPAASVDQPAEATATQAATPTTPSPGPTTQPQPSKSRKKRWW